MACKHCEISTYIRDNSIDLSSKLKRGLLLTVDEAKTVELVLSVYDVVIPTSNRIACNKASRPESGA